MGGVPHAHPKSFAEINVAEEVTATQKYLLELMRA